MKHNFKSNTCPSNGATPTCERRGGYFTCATAKPRAKLLMILK